MCEALQSFEFAGHALALQELSLGYDLEDGRSDSFEHGEWLFIVAKPAGCFRCLGFVFDRDVLKDYSVGSVGHSHFDVRVLIDGNAGKLHLRNVHLPHSKRPMEDLQDACQSLEETRAELLNRPVCLLGDFNLNPTLETTRRAWLVHTTLQSLGIHHLSLDRTPTRINSHRRLDHLGYNDAFLALCSMISPESSVWRYGHEEYWWQLQLALQVDHVMISHEVIVEHVDSKVKLPKTSKNRVGKYVVSDKVALHAALAGIRDDDMSQLEPLLRQLELAQSSFTSRAGSLRYRDVEEVRMLCRVRSVTACPMERARLSKEISERRRVGRAEWLASLWDRAAAGDWRARQYLMRPKTKNRGIHHFVQQSGSVSNAVKKVAEFFHDKFSQPFDDQVCQWPWLVEVGAESPIAESEVLYHVSKAKCGRTSGPSGVSHELLKEIVTTPRGVKYLTRLINCMHADPQHVPPHMFDGLVVLIEKTRCVSAPRDLRPIVLTEVLIKIVCSIVMDRTVSTWPAPHELLGGMPGIQVAETLKCAQALFSQSAMYRDEYIYLRLDIAGAFDNSDINSLLRLFEDHYHPQVASSCRFMQRMMQNQRLRFTFLGAEWIVPMMRGTVQGGTHSPKLFAHLLAGIFSKLRQRWERGGEDPPFKAQEVDLWSLLFIDDGILAFRNMQQALRLFPEVLLALNAVGLQVNLSKSKILGLALPDCLPGLFQGIQVVDSVIFLGVPLKIDEWDAHILGSLLGRSTAAFLSARRLLVNARIPLSKRVYMFEALVVSSVGWALGMCEPTADNLHQASVHGTTLMVWLLRLRQHSAWQDAQQYKAIRHVAKVWSGAVWGGGWDQLLAVRHWTLLGHVCRSRVSKLAMVLTFQTSHFEAAEGWRRRYRTGGDWTRSKRARNFMQTQYLDVEAAAEMPSGSWNAFVPKWLAWVGLAGHVKGHNVCRTDAEHMFWSRRCVQGACSGSRVVFCRWQDEQLQMLVFHWQEGWQFREAALGDSRPLDILEGWLLDIWSSDTVHFRVCVCDQLLSDKWPAQYSRLWSLMCVVEYSGIPAVARGLLKWG